jgi:hypothetical protein
VKIPTLHLCELAAVLTIDALAAARGALKDVILAWRKRM